METRDPPTKTPSLVCPICNQRLQRPHLLPCLHVFCLVCLQDECQGKSPDRFHCPLCVTTDEKDRKSVHARPWHGFERVLEKETETQSIQNGVAEVSRVDFEDETSRVDDDVMDSDDSSSAASDRGGGTGNRRGDNGREDASNALEAPLSFPCTVHVDRLADTFCSKCQQLACQKCVSSFHRRCQQFSDLASAVESKRSELEQIHGKMAANLVACNEVKGYNADRVKELEEMRTRVLIEIKTFRTELVNLILSKEKALTIQANRLVDGMKNQAVWKLNAASKMSESLHKQMEFLDLSISVNGEGELLPLIPGIATGIAKDAELIGGQYSDDVQEVTFSRDEMCQETITNSLLGHVNMANSGSDESTNPNQNNQCCDLDLTLVTSFHGGTRDDVTEPLLTDLILLANGDVILTDRDNKCVKKFNQSGKLLTRVRIEAIPSRIASVSHGRAVISVMTKKCLYFLSLFGTIRVLNSVPVKKIYSFLTSIGDGLLIAGTNQCDSIDLISERGETIRKILTQKPDRAIIARPLYLTPVVPHSAISLKLAQAGATSTNANSNNESNQGVRNSNSQSNGDNTTSVVNNKNINKDNAKVIMTSSSTPSLKKSLNSSKVLPQIGTKNERNGGGEGRDEGRGGKSNSISGPPSVATSASKASRRRTSLPATDHVTQSPQQQQQQQASLMSPSSSTSLSVSSNNLSSSSSSPSSSQIALLVSDSGKRVLFRLEQDGSTTFTFKSSPHQDPAVTLECPLGVTVHESGLTLLADRDSDSVILLDQNGRYIKKVLTSRHAVSKPCAIYAANKGTVCLSQVDGMVKIFKPVKP